MMHWHWLYLFCSAWDRQDSIIFALKYHHVVIEYFLLRLRLKSFFVIFFSSSSVESVLRCNETDSKLVLIPCSLLLVFLLYDFSRKAIVLQPTCLVQLLKIYTSTVKRTLTDSVGEIFTNIEFDQLSRRQFSNTFLKLSYFLSITVAIAVEKKKKKKMKKTLPLKK